MVGRIALQVSRGDKEFMCRAVEIHPPAFQFSDPLRGDVELADIAVSNDGQALKWATPNLQSNFLLVCQAIDSNGLALQYAGDLLKANHYLATKAVMKNPYALQWVSPELAGDYSLVKSAIVKEGCALQFASPDLRRNNHLVALAMRNNVFALAYADRYNNNAKEILEVMQITPAAFLCARDNLKHDQIL